MKTGPSMALFLALGCVLLFGITRTRTNHHSRPGRYGSRHDRRRRARRDGDADKRRHRQPAGPRSPPTEGTTHFTALLPGNYTIAVEIPGFRKVELFGVELQVNQRAQIDIQLEVGNVERDGPRLWGPPRCSRHSPPFSAP